MAVWIVSILDIIIDGEGNALCMRDIGIPLAAAVHPYPMHLATLRLLDFLNCRSLKQNRTFCWEKIQVNIYFIY